MRSPRVLLTSLVWLVLAGLAACGDQAGNGSPSIAPLTLTTAEDTPVSGKVDARDAAGNALPIEIGTPQHGTATQANNVVTYAPAANYNGPDSIPVHVSDGTKTADATIEITVTSVNDPPMAGSISLDGVEDTVQTIPGATLTAHDTDVDLDHLTVVAVGNAVNCAVSVSGGDVTFTPAANFSGDATFDYTVSDGTLTATGHVTVTVRAVDDPPVAVDDAVDGTEDTPQTIPGTGLLANDTDAEGDTLTITAVGNAVHCTVSLVGGDVSFTPDPDFNGNATFEYTVSDGTATDIGVVTVAVAPVNDAPVAVDDLASTELNTAITIPAADLLANDTDVDGPALTITAVQNAQHGTATLDGTNITFTPDTDFLGPATFEYVVSDGSLTDTGLVTVTVFTTSVCGDGQVTGLEKCDDGNTNDGDGCSALCRIEPGFVCAGQPSVCTTVCGDHIIAGGETCDDGNTISGDGCSATCQREFCGDGVVNNSGTEQCDDGNADDTDGCTTQCVKAAVCTATALPGGANFTVDPATGHCYASFGATTNFVTAEAACVASGGYLATIADANEEAFVLGARDPAQSPWIGAADETSTTGNTADDVFVWVSGEPWSFRHFAAGEPDNDGGNADCVHITNDAGEWADTQCASTAVIGRICEFDLQHQVPVAFSFTGAAGSETTFPADGTAPFPGLAAIPVMSRGSGILPNAAANAFSSNTWNVAALDANKYYSFTVTPAATFAMSFTSLALDEQKSSTGPTTFVIRSSLDNFTADLGTFTPVTSLATAHTTLPLGAAFANLSTPVEFRIYAFGASSSAGTWRIDNVVLLGSAKGP